MFNTKSLGKCLNRNPKKFLSYYQFQNSIAPFNSKLINHKIYGQISDMRKTKIFMESHVFSVWEYLTMLKALQRELATRDISFLHENVPDLPYLINQIVLNEEIEEESRGEYLSAMGLYQLYINSMDEIGADSNPIKYFVDCIKVNKNWNNTIRDTITRFDNIPIQTYEYLNYNLKMIELSEIHELAGIFFFGREDINSKFILLIKSNIEHEKSLSNLKNIIKRHVDDDSKNKNPILGEYINNILCKDDDKKWKKVEISVIEAIKKRIELWDGMLDLFERERLILF